MDTQQAIQTLAFPTPKYVADWPPHSQIHEALAYTFGSMKPSGVPGLEMQTEHMRLHADAGAASDVWLPPGMPKAALTFNGHSEHHERLRLVALEWLRKEVAGG